MREPAAVHEDEAPARLGEQLEVEGLVGMQAHEDDMKERQARRWHSWEDYILEWCGRPEFRSELPRLLHGEDPDFVRYVEQLVSKQLQGGSP